MTKSLAAHRFILVSTSAAIVAVPARVYAVMVVGGTAVGTLKLYDAADANGTATITFGAAIGATEFIDFENVGPVDFPTKLYAALGGTGALAYIWYD